MNVQITPVSKSIASKLTDGERALLATECPQLFMDCFNFDVTYDFSDSITTWRAGEEGKRALEEQIKASHYDDETKKSLRSALVTVEGNRDLPKRLTQLGKMIKLRTSKGWVAFARTEISMEQLKRCIWLKKQMVKISKLSEDLPSCLVWSPAFTDNPGLFKHKMSITDELQACINNVTRFFGEKDFQDLDRIQQCFTFPEELRCFPIRTTSRSKSDFLIDYKEYDYATGYIQVDDNNYIFNSQLVTINQISFAINETGLDDIDLDFTVERDGLDSFRIVPNA